MFLLPKCVLYLYVINISILDLKTPEFAHNFIFFLFDILKYKIRCYDQFLNMLAVFLPHTFLFLSNILESYFLLLLE